MSKALMRNFLNFIASIRKSPKPVLRQLYEITKNDVRTTTGSNLRNILLLTDLSNVDDLMPSMVEQFKYKEISNTDMWRVPLIKEVIDMKCGMVQLPAGWSYENMEDILNLACTE